MILYIFYLQQLFLGNKTFLLIFHILHHIGSCLSMFSMLQKYAVLLTPGPLCTVCINLPPESQRHAYTMPTNLIASNARKKPDPVSVFRFCLVARSSPNYL